MLRLQSRKTLYLFFIVIVFSINIRSQEEVKDSDTYYAKAKKAALQNDFITATKYCEKAIELAPLDQDIKEYLGKCYMEIGDFEKARITLLEVLKKSPKRVDARHYLLNIETQSKRYSSAVCYANELLEITPYSKVLWIKKINLYRFMDNFIEARRAADRILQIYPDDEEVIYLRNSVLKDNALKNAKGNEFAISAIQYEEVLNTSPADVDAYIGLINIHIKSGNNQKALEVANRGLIAVPNSNKIIHKKIAILEREHKYQEALNIVKSQIKRKAPGNYYKLRTYLLSESARYQRNQDPYELYNQLYAKNKRNTEAYNYLVNTSISRGYYSDAETLLLEGLKLKPNSKTLLSKLLMVYESQGKTKKHFSTLTKLHTYYPDDYDINEKYDAYLFASAKTQFQEKNYKEAQKTFLEFNHHPEYGTTAKQYTYSIYLAKKEYDKAINLIEKLILEFPNENKYKLRKIDLFVSMEDYEEAFELANTFKTKYPKEQDFEYKVNELSIDYIKYEAQRENWDKVKIIADNLITNDTTSYLAYNYAIGARVALEQYEEAQQLIGDALIIFPDSKDLKLKLAGSYSAVGEYDKAINILQELQEIYPYSTSIKGALIEEMYKKGKNFDELDSIVPAIEVYSEILELNPKEKNARIKYASDLILVEKYGEAMELIDEGLIIRKGDTDLFLIKGVIYEKMEDYENALKYQKLYIPPYNKLTAHNNHLDYLESMLLKNQLNVAYLKAMNDSTAFGTSVSTIEYLRFAKNNTYIGRVNYAGRRNGVGVQGEIDWVHHFSNKSYSKVNIGASNRHFAKYQVGLDLTKPVSKTWLAEVGAKYVKTRDDINFYTIHLGAEKSYKNIWLNLKLFGMTDEKDFFENILLQSRVYMQNEKDYLIVMASMGSAPINEKLDMQINSFLFYTSSMVGAGYNHQFNHKTSVGVIGNWFNYEVKSDLYVNQFNIFIIAKTKF